MVVVLAGAVMLRVRATAAFVVRGGTAEQGERGGTEGGVIVHQRLQQYVHTSSVGLVRFVPHTNSLPSSSIS